MIKLTDILNEDCWKGYKQIGGKMKNGKMVPNCVPESVEENSINEASMTVSIANIVDELFPKEFFWVYNPQDKERVKSVIGDLVRTLNTFYKKQGIKVRFTDSNIKMKMYSKEIKEGLSSTESLEHMKLLNKAMRVMPGSQKQKDIIKQLNVLRIKGGMKPLKEDLRKWFGKGKTGSSSGGGWDRYSSTGKKLGKCGDGDDGDAYAACLSKEKANKLGPKGRASFVKRKRADQKKAGDTKKGGNRT